MVPLQGDPWSAQSIYLQRALIDESAQEELGEWVGADTFRLRVSERIPSNLLAKVVNTPPNTNGNSAITHSSIRAHRPVGIIMGTLPFAMIGAVWLMYLLGYNFSVAVGVGFIALAGVAVEIGVIMLVYLNQSYQAMLATCEQKGLTPRRETLRHAVLHGAGMRVRPVMMTAVILVLLVIPVLFYLWRRKPLFN